MKLTLSTVPQEIVTGIRCECSEIIMKSRNGDEIIRAKVVIVKGSRAYAVCKSCNAEVEVPLYRDSGPNLYLDK